MNNPTVLPSEHSGPLTACVWYTGLYIARAFNPAVPATKAEMLALAAAGGHPTGTSGNFTKLAKAMKSRYGLVGVVTEGAGAVQAVSDAVRAAVAAKQPVAVGLAGNGKNLTPRYQSNDFGHAIAVVYLNGSPGIQLDPLAPAGYKGDPFSGTELSKFATACIIFSQPKPPPVDLVKAATDPLKAELATAQADITGLKARLASIHKISGE